ncbi:hypothetical protein JCM12298_18740 [Desulfothermus naphthae]
MERMPLAELIESELSAAIFGSDKEAIKRISILLSEKIEKIEEVELEQEETKSDLKVLIELVKQGFDDVNKRFEDMNRRFDMMFKFMSIGFTIITILIVVFKFIH